MPLRKHRERFKRYLSSFRDLDETVKAHFEMKIRHTHCVVSNIRSIARAEGFDDERVRLAELIALFHDLGRFQQFLDYGTFDDSISVNHAELSEKILTTFGFLKGFEPRTSEIITRSIRQHNIPSITEQADGDVRLFAQLLRDADKIDILKLQSEKDITFSIGHFQPETHYSIPPVIQRCFLEERIVNANLAKSINDFRILRLSWIFDMNFPATFRLLQRRGYIPVILSKIPPSVELTELEVIIQRYMHHRITWPPVS